MATTVSDAKECVSVIPNEAGLNWFCLACLLHFIRGHTVLRDVLLVRVIPDQLIDPHSPNVPRPYHIRTTLWYARNESERAMSQVGTGDGDAYSSGTLLPA